MDTQRLDDIIIEGVKLSNIHREVEHYAKTRYTFFFHCELEDEDAVYALCKKAFKEGKDHIRFDGELGTCPEDNDRVVAIKDEEVAVIDKKGCNWAYIVDEGNGK